MGQSCSSAFDVPPELSEALLIRYHRLGLASDLEEQVSLTKQLVALCPIRGSERAVSLSNLAVLLEMRFQKLGEVQDLTEAISLQREANTLCPEDLSTSPYSSQILRACYTRDMANVGDQMTWRRQSLCAEYHSHFAGVAMLIAH